jgi:protein SCO1/2
MKKLPAAYKAIIILAILILPSVAYVYLSTGKHHYKKLGIYGPKDDIDANGDTVYHVIPPFSFTNQEGESISDKDLEGKIYVASYFFASCKGICPKINGELQRVQEKFKANRFVKIVSFTVDPEHDSVPVLAEYGRRNLVKPGKWHLLTGDKKEIYTLAKKGFLASALEQEDKIPAFIHSEFLVLVDKEKHIRGMYDGTKPDEVKRLMDEIVVLLLEYKEKQKQS